ncbi:MbtH family protein [Dyella choica]|uniref:MbtH family NRPS accessory protein n=1 Tax=Dyella choica TaxID=1927959 RepID=A0A3S0Q5T3_9GAMM|nr:MbtH family NRPS accessory protein [Dyella choica]RUL77682.1 MbtH family NRPS accessory protein [Dyella choica]
MSAISFQSQLYEVVVNQEDQYSIWPVGKIVPNGWILVGKQGTKEACLDYIGDVWTDMRPRSLRASMLN